MPARRVDSRIRKITRSCTRRRGVSVPSKVVSSAGILAGSEQTEKRDDGDQTRYLLHSIDNIISSVGGSPK